MATYRTQTLSEGRSSTENDFEDGLSEQGSMTTGMSGGMMSTSAASSSFLGIEQEMSQDSKLSAIISPSAGSMMSAISKDAAKRRKPKTSMTKSNSSFVSRMTPHEHLAKRLSERSSEDLYYFANIGRSFNWMDYASATQKVEKKEF